jgi:uncharacterized protein YecE (DUF72 family)
VAGNEGKRDLSTARADIRCANEREVLSEEVTAEGRVAAGKFPTIEINGTFYSLQSVKSFEQWCAEGPDDFVFSVKGSRFITHILRLWDVRAPTATCRRDG